MLLGRLSCLLLCGAAEGWMRRIALASGTIAPASGTTRAHVLVMDGQGTTYGRREHWESAYAAADGERFSWYTGWNDLEPFVAELVGKSEKVLLPGIGNDAAMVDMYDSGWRHLTAFDYAPSGVARAAALFGSSRPIELSVADVRDLPYSDATFDAVLEKGTLDAVFLSGGSVEVQRKRNLQRAVDELHRVVRPGGVVFSVCAAAAAHLPAAFASSTSWRVLRDGSVHVTDDGVASINVDATMLAWERI